VNLRGRGVAYKIFGMEIRWNHDKNKFRKICGEWGGYKDNWFDKSIG